MIKGSQTRLVKSQWLKPFLVNIHHRKPAPGPLLFSTQKTKSPLAFLTPTFLGITAPLKPLLPTVSLLPL